MINYTDRLTTLMRDIVTRVPALSYIDMDAVLVFARFGRQHSKGSVAACHCVNLPPGEPGCYFWRDAESGRITRRTEWFVSRSPEVHVGGRRVEYLISVALPRFCSQSLEDVAKGRLYGPSTAEWEAKLDTVIHELYHIAPDRQGIRRTSSSARPASRNFHGGQFLEQVASMVAEYLDTAPDPAVYDFLRHDFPALEQLHGGLTATAFRPFPAYPRQFEDRLAEQPEGSALLKDVEVAPWRAPAARALFTDADLHVRHFTDQTSRALRRRPRAVRAA